MMTYSIHVPKIMYKILFSSLVTG